MTVLVDTLKGQLALVGVTPGASISQSCRTDDQIIITILFDLILGDRFSVLFCLLCYYSSLLFPNWFFLSLSFYKETADPHAGQKEGKTRLQNKTVKT